VSNLPDQCVHAPDAVVFQSYVTILMMMHRYGAIQDGGIRSHDL
jgi:hypothetical protein